MPATFEQLVEFFQTIGAPDVPHTGVTYMGHCFNVYRDMKEWGYSEELAQAGLFHSIYGTGLFQKFKLGLDRREEIQQLIGQRAERLAYLNCSIDYEQFDAEVLRGAPPYRMQSRLTGETIELTEQEMADLLAIQLVDRLEQVPRSKHLDFRRDAFEAMAERLGEEPRRRFEQVFAAQRAAQ